MFQSFAKVAAAAKRDPFFANVRYLINAGDGVNGSQVFFDNSVPSHTITAQNNIAWDNTQLLFGLNTIRCIPASSWLFTPNNADLHLTDKLFTMEGAFRYSNYADSSRYGMMHWPAGGLSWIINHNAAQGGYQFVWINTSTFRFVFALPAPVNNQWFHYIFQRGQAGISGVPDDDFLTFWLDGDNKGVFGFNVGETIDAPVGDFTVGDSPDGSATMDGWLGYERLTLGVARYDRTGNLPIPTEPFPIK